MDGLRFRILLQGRWGRLLLVGVALAYAATVLALYIDIVSPAFDYMGFSRYEPGAAWIGVALVLAGFPAAFCLPMQFTRPSHMILTLYYAIIYVPAVTVPFVALEHPSSYLGMALALVGGFLILKAAQALPLGNFRPAPRMRWPLDRSILLVSFASYASVFALLGVQSLPGLMDVYTVRSEYVAKLEQGPVIFSYIINWMAHIINVYFIARGFQTRRKWMWMFGILGQLYIYSFSGFKSVLFSFLLVALVFALFRWKRNHTLGLVSAFPAVMWVLVAIDSKLDIPLMTALFTTRVVMVPGLLTGYYFHFFSTHPKVYLLHGIFKSFGSYPYPDLYPVIIAERYLNTEDGYANANFWADAYANFGIPGIIVFTLLLAGLLWQVDSLAKRLPVRYTTALVIVGFFTLTNSAMLTGILTFGIFLLIPILWLHHRSAASIPS